MAALSLSSLPKFAWPPLDQEKLLLVGIGGGSDCITGFAIGQSLPTRPKEIVYANTKTRPESDWAYLSAHIATLPEARPSAGPIKVSSGGTSIDRLLPKGDRGCPWIFLLQKREEEALTEEIKAQQFSAIIAVDTGGDVLASHGKAGRDQRMLSVLQRVGLPLWLLVVAPGVDGQYPKERNEQNLRLALQEPSLRGVFALDCLLPIFQRFGPLLPVNKTPNLILSAFASKEESLLIPRGCKPSLPVEWLRLGLVFAY